ncbi:pleiotropic drug resistance ABC transporter [Fistulina hepatica ATCC 64428]|uniref:Pleiotropic drug resistance ABC transporter n=1 Tax=Fistulina hepatica ATCC 64428 TaxID=1128425 RepID=A0A0D7ACV7_9AGAR|nr:pleiotropic drug resistance ABC transporter [Fistulina hepatica ATCC 64428]
MTSEGTASVGMEPVSMSEIPPKKGAYECDRPNSPTDSEKTEQGIDFEETLRQFERFRKSAGLHTRKLGVVFDGLTVVGVGSEAATQPTFASMEARHPHLRTIINDFQGVARPGEMILVLGSPGAGCSTFIKAIANQREEYHSVTGSIHYDALTPEELQKEFRGDVLYCPEKDVHFPSLSVEQTLRFAASCRAPQGVAQIGSQLLSVFGLTHARNTPVGDAMLRGVSGGEKKRISIAEVFAARAYMACWDNPTRGLDSSTALEFAQALRVASDVSHMTNVAALYQAGEPLYRLFDKVCLISHGRMVYYGPASTAKQYFVDLGYEPAPRQTTADFLVSVTDATTRVPRALANPPRTPEEFVAAFQASRFGQDNRADIDAYCAEMGIRPGERGGSPTRAAAYRESAREERCGSKSSFVISPSLQARAIIRRRMQITKGNSLALIIYMCVHIFQAVLVATAYTKMSDHTSAFFSRGCVLFWAVVFPALATMGEVPMLYPQRKIIHRQQLWAWYHPFIDAIAFNLLDIPVMFFTMVVWALFLYFVPGLQLHASQVFTYFLFVFLTALTMRVFFRCAAAMFKSAAAAQGISGIGVLAAMLYNGYFLPVPSMIGALKWVSYLNPIRWSFESLLTNEFRTINGPCDQLVPSGYGYENISLANQVCTTVGALPGQATVSGSRYVELSFNFRWSHTWMNLGILLGYWAGFNLLSGQSGLQNVVLYNETQRRKSRKREARQHALAATRDGTPEGKDFATKEEEVHLVSHASHDTFTFEHIEYHIPLATGEKRRLLHDVSGYVATGKLTALMGESGAGKTTLLNVLAQRTDVGVITGDMLVNGMPLPMDFQAQTGYCQQTDTHLWTDTVYEALLFSAMMRQPPGSSLSEKEEYVDKLLKVCGLEEYRDAAVGSLGAEHLKRTTIGVELAAKPRLLLFLDEPVFDRVLLLRKGGETVYFGDIGPNSATLISYFERNGARKCGPTENPAEYMLDVVGAGATARSVLDWYQIWLDAPESMQVAREIEQIHSEERAAGTVSTVLHTEYAQPWVYQFKELLRRDLAYHWRNPGYTFGKTVLNIVGGLFIGFTFFKTDASVQGVQSKIMALFMSLFLSWHALLTAQILSDVMWNIFVAALYFLVWYWTVGFPTDRGGYVYLMLGIAFPIYHTAFGLAVAALGPTSDIGDILFVMLQSFVITFNGTTQLYSQLGWYRAAPFTYIIEGLIGYAAGHSKVVCSESEYVTVIPPSGQTCGEYMDTYISSSGGYLTNPNATSSCHFCAVDDSDAILGPIFNIYYSHHWRDFGLVFVFVVFNIFLAYAVTWLFRVRRGSPLKALFKLFARKK